MECARRGRCWLPLAPMQARAADAGANQEQTGRWLRPTTDTGSALSARSLSLSPHRLPLCPRWPLCSSASVSPPAPSPQLVLSAQSLTTRPLVLMCAPSLASPSTNTHLTSPRSRPIHILQSLPFILSPRPNRTSLSDPQRATSTTHGSTTSTPRTAPSAHASPTPPPLHRR